jgi:hypothetical protein
LEVIELLNNSAVCKHCFNKTKENEVFCCAGCEAAYSFIHDLGLEEYYSKRQNNKKPAHQLKLAPEFFDIDFIQEHIKVLTHDLRVCEVTLEGMTCSACVWLLEKIPMIDSRVKRVQVLFNQSAIRVFFLPMTLILKLLVNCF